MTRFSCFICLLAVCFLSSFSSVWASETPQNIVLFASNPSCAESRAALLVPGFGVDREFMRNFGEKLDGEDSRPCFSEVYGMNFTTVDEGYAGIRDTEESAEGSFRGWAGDVEDALTFLNGKTWTEAPTLIAWSSGSHAVITMLYDACSGDLDFSDAVYPACTTALPPQLALSAFVSVAGVPTLDVEWTTRDNGAWAAALTVLQPLSSDTSSMGCTLNFIPATWAPFLYSSSLNKLKKSYPESAALIADSTINSPEKVVFDMTGLARSDLDIGEHAQSCKPSRFTNATTMGTTIPSYAVQGIDPALFSSLDIPVLFLWGTQDLVVNPKVAKTQFEYFCGAGNTACRMSPAVESPHAGMTSDEWLDQAPDGTMKPVSKIFAEYVADFLTENGL